jgi:putative ABC transport system substrate-binding protein
MTRRDFVAALGAASFVPLAARAQQTEGLKRIGLLIPFAAADSEAQSQIAAFRDALRERGWIEGRNLRIDYRWAAGDAARIRTLARELVDLQPVVIFARTTPVTAALARETRTIPIVFAIVSDPVGDGLVASLASPGGNVTGFTNVASTLGGKWLQLLKEIAPRTERIGFIFDPKMAPGGGAYYRRLVEEAAPSAGVKVIPITVHGAADIERAFGALTLEPNGGLLVLPDVTTVTHRKVTISLAARHHLPAIYPTAYFVNEGGLVSYGADYLELYRQAASYVDRILRGARPSELPVQEPSKFQLAVNLKTARTIGLTIPQSILLLADRVIE